MEGKTALEILGRHISFQNTSGHALFDGLTGDHKNRQGVPSYDIGFRAGQEIREAVKWYQLFKLDRENPEPT